MDNITTENLFLLEFLVDSINLANGCDCDKPPGETCVSFQFLDNAPLDVCENDFGPKPGYGSETENVKSGKSCLFSLTPEQAEDATKQFDVYVSILRKMKPGWLPESVQIGNTLISIANVFNELIESVGCGCDTSPCAKTLKDTFAITNTAKEEIGTIGVYIRMSCFGKLIVTQFQMNLADKSVLFKDKEGHSLYRYKKASKSPASNQQPQQQPPPSSMGPCNPGCPEVPCQPPPQQQPYIPPCNECGVPPNQAMTQPQMEPPCGVQQPPEDPSRCYQEIGATMGGNALTIRVHKNSNKVEKVDGGIDLMNEDTCSCDESSGQKPQTNAPSCPINSRNYNIQPALNTGGGNTSPFSLKMGGQGNAANNVTIVPPVCTTPDGTQYTEISDPDKDVFILRIGKKSEGADKKSNLELELCTPKGPDLKPTPKKETRDTQYEAADAGDGGSGSGGKKGKGKGKDNKKGDKKGGKKGKKK